MPISTMQPIQPPMVLKHLTKSVEVKNGSESNTVEGSKDREKLKKACQDFEAVFLNHLLSKMRQSIPKSDLMGSSQGEEIYRGMLDDELSKQMAVSGGVGIGNVLFQQLSDRIKPKGP